MSITPYNTIYSPTIAFLINWFTLTYYTAVTLLQQEISALEELSRQLFLEVVDLYGVKVCVVSVSFFKKYNKQF